MSREKFLEKERKRISPARRIFSIILFIILLPVIILVSIVKFFTKRARYNMWKKEEINGKKLLLSSDITQIDIMEGYEFENYLKTMFFYAGFDVEVTKKSRDFGADLVLRRENAVVVVQAKRYNKAVGIKAVQEILASAPHYMATEAWVVTNSYFTDQAEELAKENGVRLLDRDELIEMSKEICRKLSIDNSPSSLIQTSRYSQNEIYGSLEQKYPHMI